MVNELLTRLLKNLKDKRLWVDIVKGSHDFHAVSAIYSFVEGYEDLMSEVRVIAENDEEGMIENLFMNIDSWRYALMRVPEVYSDTDSIIVLYAKRRGLYTAHHEIGDTYRNIKRDLAQPPPVQPSPPPEREQAYSYAPVYNTVTTNSTTYTTR
jgi:hypothetical protein